MSASSASPLRRLLGPANAAACLLLLGASSALLRGQPDPRMSLAMIAAATTHLAVGAFLLAAAALLTLRLFRAEVR